MRIGIVAGEASGDLLAAALIEHISLQNPQCEFIGIAGPKMQSLGARTLYPMERLSVMGFIGFGRLIELIGIRRKLLRQLLDANVDAFIGVDAPDFNLGLSRMLRKHGIKTIHYVSPSVWAWRQYRVKKIAKSVDLMLTLFPFEAEFYKQHDVPVRFVGHPLADIIELDCDRIAARALLNVPVEKKIIALLPGSRTTEVQLMAQPMIETAKICLQCNENLQFVVPLANASTKALFQQALDNVDVKLPLTIIDGMSRETMAASDVILLASGTAALEALLINRPMVVVYKVAPLTYWIAKRLVKLTHYSLPNLLWSKPLVPEYIQDEFKAQDVAKSVMEYIQDASLYSETSAAFREIHLQLRNNASETAADAILSILKNKTKLSKWEKSNDDV